METLPVNDYEDQIIENIRTHQVVIITGETGSGKSTQIPQLLYRNGYFLIGKMISRFLKNCCQSAASCRCNNARQTRE